jgi:hypothetical protein
MSIVRAVSISRLLILSGLVILVSIVTSQTAHAGSITNVVINGTVKVGQTLTSTITKSGSESGPSYQWVYADTTTATQYIIDNGATKSSIVVPAIGGKYIQLQYYSTLDGVFLSRGSSWTLVAKASSSISFTPPSLTYGSVATLQATGLVETSTGTINFTRQSDSILLCSATKNSGTKTASCTYTPLSVASLQIRASYGGDASYETSSVTSPLVTPSKAAPSLSLSYSQASYQLGGTASPSISYSGDGTVSYSTVTSSSICSVNSITGVVTMNGPGDCTVTASASSGTNYLSATTDGTYNAVISPSNNFTVSKGPTGYSIILNISPQVGVSSYTVRMYTSYDNYVSVDATYYNYVSGSELTENTIDCNSVPRICWAASTYRTMRFTISANSDSGYTVDSTESAKSNKVGFVRASSVGMYYPESGIEGFKIALVSDVPGRTSTTVYFYPSANGYSTNTESRTVTTHAEQVAIPAGEYYRTSAISHGGVSGDVTWFDSPMTAISAAGSERFVYAKPANPANVHITAVVGRSVTATWDRASGALQNYTVALSTDGTSIATYGAQSADTTTYTFTNVTVGNVYYVIVANKTNGTGSRYGDFIASPETATVFNAPSAPSSGSLSPGDTNVRVTWTVPTDNGGSVITNYLVQRSLDNSTWTDTVTVSAGDTFTILTGLTNNVAYHIRVAAVNVAGASSWTTFGATATPTGFSRAVVQPVLNVTTSSATLSALITSAGNMTTPSLEWGEYNGTLTTVTFAARDSATSTITLNVTGLTPGRRYQVGSLTSPGIYSDPGGHPYYFTTTPDGPTNVTVVAGATSLTVSWDAMPGASGYQFSFAAEAEYLGVSAGTGCPSVTSYSNGRSSCTITGLTSGRTYDISVTATIDGADYGNGTSVPTLTTGTTTGGVATISISIAGSVTTVQKGKTILLTVAINVAGKIKFYANGKVIAGCASKSGTTSATCSWKPTTQGQFVRLTAFLNPTSGSYSNVTSSPLMIATTRRTGLRS